MKGIIADPKSAKAEPAIEGCYFKDKIRRADYVIVPKNKSLTPLVTYIKNLERLGLEFEVVDGETVDKTFILVHLPYKITRYFAELYNIGLEENRELVETKSRWYYKYYKTPISNIPIKTKGEFTSADRILIINKLLEETKYGDGVGENGVTQLTKAQFVETAYALHDGYVDSDPSMYSNDRQLLFHNWTRLRGWYQDVPIDMIRKYFGSEVGFYFAFFEYLNCMLMLAAIIGTVALLTNYVLLYTVPITYIEEVCSADNVILCPTCQLGEFCTFKPLSAFCGDAKQLYLFDNNITVGFAVFMAFWASTFANWWRRKERKLRLRWDVQYEYSVVVRKEYLAAAKKTRINEVTGNEELYVATHIRYFRLAVSIFIVLLLISLIAVGIFGTIIIKIAIKRAMDKSPYAYVRKRSTIGFMFFGTVVYVYYVKICGMIYGKMTVWMTNFENPRTQAEYDRSFLYKKFVLSFFNNFLNFMYLAFFRGRLFTVPHRYKYNVYFERDTCQPFNCLFPIVLWMTFILLMKTYILNVITLVIQNIRHLIRKMRRRKQPVIQPPLYEADFKLASTNRLSVTTSINELVIAYGHSILFVSAFPLAPLFVLLNSVVAARMQARRLILNCRRPTPTIKQGLGAFNGLMTGLTFFSTATSGIILAFTGGFMERIVYEHRVDSSLKGYINSTLSQFATQDFNFNFSSGNHKDPTICYYKAQRYPPDHPEKYELTSEHWIDVAWKLLFVVTFETVDKKFILIHLPQKANKHFAEVYTVGIEENRTFNFEKPIWFSKVFTTPISIIPFKKKGEFTSAERIIIINKLLEETMYGEDIIQKGISELIRVNLVETAYPLHDGYLHYDPLMYNNDRQLLYHHWATLSNWYKEVPIDMIHRYFGCQIAFYFAWLEYFNYRLILVAILGSLVVITNYILVTSVPINQIDEICDQHNMWICPKCQFSEQCTFVPLSAYCSYAQYNYVFDNYVTVGFAIFMTFWATSFVHSWRRKENRLKLRWDVQYQNPVLAVRQQYLDAAKGNRLNRVTGNLEPYVAKHIRYLGMAVSVSICLFAIFLIVGVVCGTILLDVMLETSMDSNPVLYFRKKSTIPYMVSGCLMNVIFIKLFSKVYGRLSIWLTNLEIPRTQTDYDKSFLYKKYFLSFVNNYLNFFYLAFLRGRLYTLPNRYKYFSLIERDTCQPLNCIFVIWIWMSFLLMLKTFAINVVKILIQNLGSCIGKLRGKLETSYEGVPQYEADFMLKTTDQFLITTYFNDMVIAYGHTTLFVAAFPLAPLCVLLNNILEVRMQAHSLITECRRPTPKVREGIGAWNGIITGVTFFSTVTNAFVIAFTSSFIEREIYQFTVKSDLEGYVNSTLAKFATKDYNFNFTREGHYDPIICYFKAHRFPPDHPDRYELTSDHWTELTWKLISVLIFEHIILVCNIFFAYMIPDMPRAVRIQQKLDRTLAKEARARLYYGRRWRRSSRAPRRGTSVETPSFKSHSISSAMGLKLY